jgi:hypothetical protein
VWNKWESRWDKLNLTAVLRSHNITFPSNEDDNKWYQELGCHLQAEIQLECEENWKTGASVPVCRKHMIWVNPKVFQQINKQLNVFCVYQACEDPIPSIQGQNHQQQSVKSPHHHNPSNSRPSHKTINKDWRPKRN